MLTAFFVVGGLWFWMLVAVEVLLLAYFVEGEQPFQSFVSVLIFLALIHLFGDAHMFAYIKDKPLETLKWVGVYVTVGFGWSMVKFYFHTSKLKRKIEELKKEFLELNTYINDPPREEAWQQYLANNIEYDEKKHLEFSYYSSTILFWLSYWPISMFWTMLNDPIRRFFNWGYETFLIGIYKKIHERTVGSATKL